jgi:hypothetical protein
VVVGAVLTPLALAERSNGKTSWIEESSLVSRAGETVKEFLVGVYSPAEIATGLVVGLLALALLARLRGLGDRDHTRAVAVAVVGAVAVLLPLLLAAAHLVDVFDGRNVIAAWVPFGILLAVAIAVPPPRVGSAIGAAVCVVSLGVIAGVNALPQYQRDNWRGAAQALPRRGMRVIVSDLNASLPLSVYLPAVRPVRTLTVTAAEIDFVALRARRSGRSPLAAVVPTMAPPGFRLVQERRTASYALTRFSAPHPEAVSVKVLQRLSEPDASRPQAEAMTEG